MRRFFRFSIRDLLWLTLVVAVGLGWLVRERQLHFAHERQLQAVQSKSTWWRKAVGALEDSLIEDGAGVEWKLESSEVMVIWPGPTKPHKWGSATYPLLPTSFVEPTIKDEDIPVNAAASSRPDDDHSN